MPTHEASCDKCGYQATFSDPLRCYKMPDGSTVVIHGTFVWCATCGAIQWGEELAVLAELERELMAIVAREESVVEELSVWVSKYETLDQVLAARTRNLEERIAWRRVRVSGPRCLECGSTHITPLAQSETPDGNDQWTLEGHPDCAGVVTVLRLLVLALDRRWFRYSPEGEMLET